MQTTSRRVLISSLTELDNKLLLESGTGTPGEPEAEGPGTRAGGHIARSAVYASRTNRDASGGEARASVRSTLLLVVPRV
jgi:hypothetical protein